MNSVEGFHERIEKLMLRPNDTLITADVKDFFVVGEHQYLAKMAASILNVKDQKSRRGNHLVFAPDPVC